MLSRWSRRRRSDVKSDRYQEHAIGITLGSMIPAGAHCYVLGIDTGSSDPLPELEHTIIASATEQRRREFTAGRHCARIALAQLGLGSATIGRGLRGQPMWPVGVTGSISHSGAYAAAVVARTSPEVASIGIDLEVHDALDEASWPPVLVAAEQDVCRRTTSPQRAATILFAAKEAVFKAQYPLTGAELDFLDVQLTLHRPLGPGVADVTLLDHAPELGSLHRFTHVQVDVVAGFALAVAVMA